MYAGTISRADNEDDHEALLSMYSSEKFTSFVHEVAFDNAIDAVIAVDEGSVVGKSAVVISREEGKNESA